jgi:flagellar hook-associated protein 2
LGNGIDVQGTVASIMQSARQPEVLMQQQQATLNTQSTALQSINGNLVDLQTKVQALTDFSGQLGARTVSSSNNGLLTATADGSAALTSHQIIVNNLATTSSFYTNTVQNGSTALATGSFDIDINGTKTATITVDGANNTLDGIARTINAANAGVTANVIVDSNGSRLSLLSSTTGHTGEISISNNIPGIPGSPAVPGLAFTEAVVGNDASLKVDGIDITIGSNTVKNVIAGITLNLQGADSSKTVNLGVTPDVSQSSAAIQSFVNSYNTAIKSVNAQFVFDSTSKTAQPLASNSSLMLVQQQLYTAVTYATPDNNNGISSLSSLGITVNNDGTLSVNSTKLSNALTSQNTDVQNFFQAVGTGFAQKFTATAESMTDSTQGALSLEIGGIKASVTSLQKSVNDFEARMTFMQQNLLNQYSKIDAMLQQMPLIISQINSQLGSL